VEIYLNIEGLAKYLGIAEKTIRKWVLNREIPYHKIKKVIRFRLSEIEKWIDEDDGRLAGEGNTGPDAGLPREIISLDELAAEELAGEIPDTGDDE